MYENAVISASGALINFSGKKTGRSPKDKRIVYEDSSKDDVWVSLTYEASLFELSPSPHPVPRKLTFDGTCSGGVLRYSGDLSTSKWTSTPSKSTESELLIT